MMERVLKGVKETLSYSEAEEMAERAMTELLFYVTGLVDETVGDKEERADAKINLANMVGRVRNGYFLAGLLCDPDHYLTTTFPDKVQVMIEEVKNDD